MVMVPGVPPARVALLRQAFLDKEISGDVEAFVKQQLRDLLAGEATGLRLGPLINFGEAVLKNGIRRVVNNL